MNRSRFSIFRVTRSEIYYKENAEFSNRWQHLTGAEQIQLIPSFAICQLLKELRAKMKKEINASEDQEYLAKIRIQKFSFINEKS